MRLKGSQKKGGAIPQVRVIFCVTNLRLLTPAIRYRKTGAHPQRPRRGQIATLLYRGHGVHGNASETERFGRYSPGRKFHHCMDYW
jgi:hypothetical protein